MSIKRTKQRAFSADKGEEEEDAGPFAKPKEPPKVWAQDVEGKPDGSFVPYAMTTHFPKGALVLHAKFGKGVVTGMNGTSVEVLFQDGTKKLGHAPS